MNKIALLTVLVLTVAGCQSTQSIRGIGAGTGAGYTPVVDSPLNDKFYRDLRECRQIASRVQNNKDANIPNRIVQGAVAGAIIAGILGEKPKDGALIGGLANGVNGLANAERHGKRIIQKCLDNRGHRVLL